jgi:hypothetical protein
MRSEQAVVFYVDDNPSLLNSSDLRCVEEEKIKSWDG